MDLLGVELTSLARLHQLCSVVECRGPVETVAECLAHKGARRGVVPTVSAMYVDQQLAALLPGDRPQRDVVWTPSIKFAIMNATCCSLACHPLYVLLLLWQGSLEQVGPEFFSPASLLRFEREEQTCF